MTAYLQCFWISPQIGFASFRNLTSSFGEVYDPIHTEILVSKFKIFFKIFKQMNMIFRFLRLQTQENRCWGPVTFLLVFYIQPFINLFIVLWIFYKFGLIRDKSWSYICFLQYGISRFFINNYIKFEMIVKGVSGKSGFFSIELPIELPIDSAWNH